MGDPGQDKDATTYVRWDEGSKRIGTGSWEGGVFKEGLKGKAEGGRAEWCGRGSLRRGRNKCAEREEGSNRAWILKRGLRLGSGIRQASHL